MSLFRRQALGTKLALVAAPFLALALCSIAVLVWMSLRLEGGAAAVNEAGRMRMQAWRMMLSVGSAQMQELPQQFAQFDRSLALLREGDPARPLHVPWDDALRADFDAVEADWRRFRSRFPTDAGLPDTAPTAALAAGIERKLARWTAAIHLLQLALMAMAPLAAAVLLYSGYRFVLEPVAALKHAINRLQDGDLGARVDSHTHDEFGSLAAGFNDMAEQLQGMYRNLEGRVREQTAQLQDRHERLESLYEVTNLVTRAETLDDLADGFVHAVMRIARADGVALRWSDESNRRYLMLACEGLPEAMVQAEHCLDAGEWLCGVPGTPGAAEAGADAKAATRSRVIPLLALQPMRMQHCTQAGFQTLVSVPIRLHGRLMGEVDLFFHARRELAEAESVCWRRWRCSWPGRWRTCA